MTEIEKKEIEEMAKVIQTKFACMNTGIYCDKYFQCRGCPHNIGYSESIAIALFKAGYRKIDGDTSDGYHTFNELYHHRAVLFAMICNQNNSLAWKSKKHSDGTMFDNMFIVGIETAQGQATYHYDILPYWDYFKVKELETAPIWDGHTPKQAIERIRLMADDAPIVCTKAEVVKEFAEKLKQAIEKAIDSNYKVMSSRTKADEMWLTCSSKISACGEILQTLNDLAEQYGKENNND